MRTSSLPHRSPRRRAVPRVVRLEDRTAPSAGGLSPKAVLRQSGELPVSLVQPPPLPPGPAPSSPWAPPAFDDLTGRALPGNRSRVSDPLLRLYNGLVVDRLLPPDELLQVSASGHVAVRITGYNVTSLEPPLTALGFQKYADRPEYHLTEGVLPVTSLPAAEGLWTQGLLGITPIRRPQTGVGAVTSQADWAMEADRTRVSEPHFANGFGVRVGVLSDSYNVNAGAATNAAQDIASGDLPAGGVTVWQEGPAGSSDEGRAMLQLVHDIATGSPLSFASAFFGEANFANQIQILANPAQGNCQVITDDVFYFEEPMYQDGLIAQAIDDVVVNRGVSYFALGGNHANTGYENVGWTESNADPLLSRLFDFNPGAGVDTRQRVTIANGGFARIVFQWDDPHFTATGVDTDLDIYLVRADTGAIVASAVDNNISTQVPSELLIFNNTTGQTQFDVLIRRFSGPNPGRFKYVHLGNGSPIGINEFFNADVATQTPHSAAVWAQGVGAVAYFDRPNPEPFTSQGGNVVVFNGAGGPITPQVRSIDVAGVDNVDTTFFGTDTDGNGFPNFSGTSAAAPNVAAVAALLKDANPTFTPSNIYTRLESRAEDVHLPGFDNKTGSGLVNAYDAVVGLAKYQETNNFDGFESGALGQRWETRSTGAGRITVSNANGPATGSFHVTLDSAVNGVLSLNELTLRVNLANVNNAVLSFRQREFSDEDHPMPATFTGSGNFDGVALSTNGTDWFRLVSLTGANSTSTYQSFTFNLSKFAADHGLTLDATTFIRFQQYDDFGITTDGMAFDDIQVTRTGTVSGVSYDDANGNGKRDAGEAARPGQFVYLDANGNNRFDWGNAVTYTSPQLPTAVLDAATIRVPLTVSGFGGTLSDVDVRLDISHTWTADLDIFLIAPDGTRVELTTDNGGSGDNYTGTTFDDEADVSITAGAAPFAGRFRPEGSLSVLDGKPLSGTWYLEVTDDFLSDVGTLNSWSLTLSRAFASTDTPIATIDNGTIESNRTVSGLAGLVSDVNVTININHPFTDALDVFLIGPNGVTVELTTDNGGSGDNYVNTTFDDEAAISITAGTAPFTGRFKPEGSLAALDGISPNGTWTLRVIDDDGFGDVGQLVSWSLELGRDFSQDIPPIAVPDPGTVNATLPVAGLTGAIVDVDVNLNLTHTWNSDLDVFLISPTGTKVELFTDVGINSDNFTNLTLDDSAAVPVTAGLGPVTGRFRPEGLLSAFNGESANGTWTLEVTDDLVDFSGTIVDWSLTLSTAATAVNTTKISIFDQATVASFLSVSGVSGNVNDVNVTLDITHTWTSDLDIYLIGPDGARVELTTDNGGSGDNYTNTTFDDEAATPITAGSAPFTGSFRPEGSLAIFDGINPNGLWFLEVTDDAGSDTGTLNSWSITLTTGEIHAITNAAGQYTLSNLGFETFVVREVLPPGRYHTEPLSAEYAVTVTDTNANFIDFDFGSQADATGPNVTITPVSPDPRNTSVGSIQIVFNEPVTGFDLGDLTLTRDGGANLLTGAQTLSTVDNTTFTLGNLAGITGTAGVYGMAYAGLGSGVVDRALNAFTGFVFEEWTVDTIAPTASAITRADPNPTAAASVSWNIVFSEPVVNLAAANFSLVNVGLGGAPAIIGVAGGGANWTVTASTGTGSGTLGLNLTGVGTLTDLAGNAISGLPFVGEVYNVSTAQPPRVLPIVINAGAAQRSRVTSIEVPFDQLVTLPGAPATAFQLKRQGDGALVTLAAAVVNTTTTKVTLTFTGGAVNANSLADGRYTLTVFAASVSGPGGALDGDGNGTGGDDFVLVGNPATNKLHRIFGDSDGDGDVDATDYGAFRAAFGGSNNAFDFDNDGDVDAADFGQFRARFGSSV
jgi:subtilisin-like proprotein convertase family protein